MDGKRKRVHIKKVQIKIYYKKEDLLQFVIVVKQNRYNNFKFDPLPLINLEFRLARVMIWFNVVTFTLFNRRGNLHALMAALELSVWETK